MKHQGIQTRLNRIDLKTKPRTLPWVILLKPGEAPPVFKGVPGERVLILHPPKNYVPTVSKIEGLHGDIWMNRHNGVR